MSEILEERASEEVIKRDEAIEVLQKELDRVKEEKIACYRSGRPPCCPLDC